MQSARWPHWTTSCRPWTKLLVCAVWLRETPGKISCLLFRGLARCPCPFVGARLTQLGTADEICNLMTAPFQQQTHRLQQCTGYCRDGALTEHVGVNEVLTAVWSALHDEYVAYTRQVRNPEAMFAHVVNVCVQRCPLQRRLFHVQVCSCFWGLCTCTDCISVCVYVCPGNILLVWYAVLRDTIHCQV